MAYSFGDSDLAATRLGLLADTFRPTTEAFVRAAAGDRRGGVVLDLGCGPGHTSALLAAVLGPRELVAVDASAAYVAEADDRLGARGRAVRGDVTALEPAAADVVFARFLLTHLTDPLAAVAHWRTRLAPAGVLLLEEVAGIETDDPALERYLELQRGMLRARGHELDVGGAIRSAVGGRVVGYDVPVAVAARLFAMNLATWRDSPGVDASSAQLDALAADLDRRTRGDAGTRIGWRLLQAVVAPG